MSLQLRQALSRFCTGVTVVSTETEGTVHAMTANAFTSVSLDPPLVLISIARQARMHDLLPATGTFGISVLSADQEDLALHFAGQDHAQAEFTRRSGVPVLRGAIAQFACDVAEVHEAGDHTLYLGRVREFAADEGAPLLFHSGSFGRIHDAAAAA